MNRKKGWGYLFILPVLLLFSIFIIYPVVFNICISFFEWNGINSEKVFVGFDNFVKIFHDPVFPYEELCWDSFG